MSLNWGAIYCVVAYSKEVLTDTDNKCYINIAYQLQNVDIIELQPISDTLLQVYMSVFSNIYTKPEIYSTNVFNYGLICE